MACGIDSPLVGIVRKFGAGESEMKAWIQDYKKDLKAYAIVASIEDCIESELKLLVLTNLEWTVQSMTLASYNCPVEGKNVI